MKTKKPDWLLISNPTSGRWKSLAERREIEAELDRRGKSYTTIEKRDLEQCLSSFESLIKDSTPISGVIVLGGDGTIHHIANSLLKSKVPIPVGVIPLGTGNDFAFQCGLNGSSLSELLDIYLTKQPVEIDVIAVNEQFCLQVLSTGFDAQVSARSHRLPAIIGNARYLLGLLIELLRLKPISYEISINGVKRNIDAIMISCANGRNYGGGMLISPLSDHQDGVFELIIIHPVSRFELLKVFPRIFKGSHIHHHAVEVVRVSEVEITASTIAQGDGEPIARKGMPLKIKSDRLLTWKN